MNIVGHLANLGVVCTAVIAPAALIDKIVSKDTKDTIYSNIKSKNIGFIKNRTFLFKMLEIILDSKKNEIKFINRNIIITYPSLRRFIIAHFIFISIVAWAFIPGSEPFIHEAHQNAHLTGWVIGGYQIHTMIIREWISLYICSIIISLPLDYISAAKTLSIAGFLQNGTTKTKIYWLITDVIITFFLVFLSFFTLLILALEFDLNLPEKIYTFIGGSPLWLSHKALYENRFLHAVIVMTIVTGLVLILYVFLYLSSIAWAILNYVRVYRIFAIDKFNLREFPFTISAFSICLTFPPLYFLYAILSNI